MIPMSKKESKGAALAITRSRMTSSRLDMRDPVGQRGTKLVGNLPPCQRLDQTVHVGDKTGSTAHAIAHADKKRDG
jgi:hypothetical protein